MELFLSEPWNVFFAVCMVIVLMVFSAFFSASETAMTGASRGVIYRSSEKGDKRASIVAQLQKDKSRMISGLLLGNNLANVCASTLATAVLLTLYGEAGLLIATVSMTLLLLVFCEILPKAYALRNSEQLSLRFARTLQIVLLLMSPVTRLIGILVYHLFAPFKRGGSGVAPHDETELRGIIDLHHDGSQDRRHERQMLHSILDLDDLNVEEIMTHRSEVKMINVETTWEELLFFATKSHYSRIPVYQGKNENLIGILLLRRLLPYIGKAPQGSVTKKMWKKLLQPVWFIPGYTSLLEQLHAFRRRREHFAVVVDEYGILQGIVTLEDILEEIVGEIEDENEARYSNVRIQEDGSIIVPGDVSLREINRRLEWNLPDDHASTAAGYLITQSQNIPEMGQEFIFSDYRFHVLRKVRQRLTLLRIRREKPRQEIASLDIREMTSSDK